LSAPAESTTAIESIRMPELRARPSPGDPDTESDVQ
jgi:hypothetical protein